MRLYNTHTHHRSDRDSEVVDIYNHRVSDTHRPPSSHGLFSVGIHPYDAQEAEQEWLNRVEELAHNPRCVAIGECGVDRLKGGELARQLELFEAQCDIARRYKLPIVIHCVRAQSEVLKVLKGFSNPVVMHSYTKYSQELADKDNIYFSLSGRNVAHSDAIPLGRIVLESDDSEEPIEDIYHLLAERRGIAIEELGAVVQRNFLEIFKIN